MCPVALILYLKDTGSQATGSQGCQAKDSKLAFSLNLAQFHLQALCKMKVSLLICSAADPLPQSKASLSKLSEVSLRKELENSDSALHIDALTLPAFTHCQTTDIKEPVNTTDALREEG